MDLVSVITITALPIATIVLAFFLYKSHSKVKQLQTAVREAEIAVHHAQEEKVKLQQDLCNVQNKLQMATEDPITNLLVWPLFEDRFNHAIKESARYQFIMGLLFIDIDDIKVVNNALSVEMGNALLREAAKRLQSCIRQVDSITRFGKDTFVVLLTQLSKPETAAIVAQRMLQALSQPLKVKEQEFMVTAAIGIAVFPGDGQDSASLFKNADDALHQAKQKGRHLYHFYQEQINFDSQRELIMTTSLRRESFYQELSVRYQPLIDSTTKEIFCLNALVSWQHPELGAIEEKNLFSYAEKQHKLNTISEWLIKKTCQQFVKWKEHNVSAQYLGFPLCIKQLENSQFIYRFSQIFQEEKFNPEWLILQIKDSDVQVSLDVIEKAINMLRYLKVKFMLDNVGADAFPFQHIKQFQPDFLRMHASMLSDIEENSQTVAIVKSLRQLADNLGIKIIAQGVDTPGQLSILHDLKFDLLQGNEIATVMQAEDVV